MVVEEIWLYTKDKVVKDCGYLSKQERVTVLEAKQASMGLDIITKSNADRMEML